MSSFLIEHAKTPVYIQVRVCQVEREADSSPPLLRFSPFFSRETTQTVFQECGPVRERSRVTRRRKPPRTGVPDRDPCPRQRSPPAAGRCRERRLHIGDIHPGKSGAFRAAPASTSGRSRASVSVALDKLKLTPPSCLHQGERGLLDSVCDDQRHLEPLAFGA